jgi:transcriptional regulator with XRE-family HTH domain
MICAETMTRRRHTIRQRDPDLAARIGGRVRELRRAAGLTQAALAEGHRTKAAISAVESGKALPSLDMLSLLADRLGVSVAGIVAERPEEHLPASAQIRGVDIERGRVVAELTDGRIVGMPLSAVDGLLDASIRDLGAWRLGRGRRSIDWPALGVTVELRTLLDGQRNEGVPPTATRGRPARHIGRAAFDGSDPARTG